MNLNPRVRGFICSLYLRTLNVTLGLFVRSFNVARNNTVLESEVLGSTPNFATYEPQYLLLNHYGLSFLPGFSYPYETDRLADTSVCHSYSQGI